MAVISANNELYFCYLFCLKSWIILLLLCCQEQLGKLDAILSSVADSLGNAKPDTYAKVFFLAVNTWYLCRRTAELLLLQFVSRRAELTTCGYKMITQAGRTDSNSLILGTRNKLVFFTFISAQSLLVFQVIVVIKARVRVVMQMPVGLMKTLCSRYLMGTCWSESWCWKWGLPGLLPAQIDIIRGATAAVSWAPRCHIQRRAWRAQLTAHQNEPPLRPPCPHFRLFKDRQTNPFRSPRGRSESFWS